MTTTQSLTKQQQVERGCYVHIERNSSEEILQGNIDSFLGD